MRLNIAYLHYDRYGAGSNPSDAQSEAGQRSSYFGEAYAKATWSLRGLMAHRLRRGTLGRPSKTSSNEPASRQSRCMTSVIRTHRCFRQAGLCQENQTGRSSLSCLDRDDDHCWRSVERCACHAQPRCATSTDKRCFESLRLRDRGKNGSGGEMQLATSVAAAAERGDAVQGVVRVEQS